jgi:outer membrane lipase/esterase
MRRLIYVVLTVFLLGGGTAAHASWDTGGTETVAPVLLKSSVKQTATMISSRVSGVLRTNLLTGDVASVSSDNSGLSAGDAPLNHGMWLNIGYTSVDDDDTVTEAETDITTYIVGYDFKISDRMALGVAVTYEKTDGDLDFNNGDLDGDGYTIAPYFTMLLSDNLSMDVIAGYGVVDYDQDRNFGAVKSSVDADRQFFEFTVNGFTNVEQWNFTGHCSFLYAHESQDSYTESDGTRNNDNNVDFAQLFAGIEVAYQFESVEPYAVFDFEWDVQYDDIAGADYDDTGGNGGIGCRFFFSDQLSGDIYGSTRFCRDDYDDYSIVGNLRYDF